MDTYRGDFKNLSANPTELEEVFFNAESMDDARKQADEHQRNHIFEVQLIAIERLDPL